jgi:hypothetical protein
MTQRHFTMAAMALAVLVSAMAGCNRAVRLETGML